MRLFFIFVIFYPTVLFSQNAKIDSILHSIPIKQDTIKSIFQWVSNSINYDIDRSQKSSTIRTYLVVDDQDKINTTLLTKKGVCEDYALVFNALIRRLGYNGYTVSGYTKDLYQIVKDEGHAWNVVKIKDKWYCFDPTWASTATSNIKPDTTFDDTWFKVNPNEFILTHVPYDPIWQLTEYPVIAKTNNINIPINDYFNFEDSIASYKDSRSTKFLQNLINRILKYSDANDNVNQYIKFLVDDLNVKKYNLGIERYNYAVKTYNNYIFSKNKRFQNPKLKDSEIQGLLDSAQSSIEASKLILENLNFRNSNEKTKILQEINQMSDDLKKEASFFKKYKKARSPIKRFLYGNPF